MNKNNLMFSAYEYFAEHNDELYPEPESILSELDGFVNRQGIKFSIEDIKNEISNAENRAQNISMTINKYRISGEKNTAIYTPERTKLHDKIIDEFVSHKIDTNKLNNDKRILIMICGRPGSGKTSGFNGLAYDDSFIILDADAIKARLPEYKGWNAQEVHEESSDIVEKCLQLCKMNGLSVVIETTMGTTGSALRRIREFKEGGYKVEAHYMCLPMRQACKRALKRFLNASPNGRYIPIQILHQLDVTEKNFDLIKPFVDGWSFYSNENSDKTRKAELIAQYGDIYMNSKNERY
ncbi:MAG: zeta toxin family protein, partial [Alphaproteobacteria bacterium]|nr:zeta toxin family protein [Alphaproteobacteria bacterium]